MPEWRIRMYVGCHLWFDHFCVQKKFDSYDCGGCLNVQYQCNLRKEKKVTCCVSTVNEIVACDLISFAHSYDHEYLGIEYRVTAGTCDCQVLNMTAGMYVTCMY